MTTDRDNGGYMGNSKPRMVDATAAFFLSTIAAAIAFPFAECLSRVLRGLWRTGFDIAGVLDGLWAFHPSFHPLMEFGVTLAVWGVFMVLSLVPYAIGIAVIRRFGWHQWFVFPVFGMLTAISACGVTIIVIMSCWGQFLSWRDCLSVLPECLMCGTVAGGVCGLYFRVADVLLAERPH